MIKVEKSGNIPGKLSQEGAAERDRNNALYDLDPDAYNNGTKKFKIKSSIYGDKSVKDQLINEQSGKCCFCESDFTATGYGDVEHFRPKNGYRQKKGDKLKKPGYYWQAYEWTNLFFSCEICNRRNKKNFFPLKDDNHRARCHHDNIQNEHPLLIHPSLDDPEQHIGFREEVPFPKDEKGEKSISAFGIGRQKLNDNRREYLNHVKNNYTLAKIDLDGSSPEFKEYLLNMLNMTEPEARELIALAGKFIEKAAKKTSKFAAVVRANYPDLPR